MKRITIASVLLIALLAGQVSRAGEVLKWNGYQKDPHPCLYVTARDVAQAKRTRRDLAALAALKNFNIDGALDQVVSAALLAEHPGAQKTVVAGALKAMDALIGQIPRTTKHNTGPHAYAKPFGVAVGLADAALATKSISAADRAGLVAKIAKASYMVNDPNYWGFGPGKGSLCPNMYTSAAAYRLTLAALIPSHPMAKKWFNGALRELKDELDKWTDPAGGMIECPHYSMVIFDQWVAVFQIARNAGASDNGHLFDAQLRQAIEWLGNISTPRDKRCGGFRRLPSLGHTYANERTGMFGVMACLWKQKDPAFAAEMQWMHLEHGSFGEPGILSYYPGFMGYRSFFRESGVRPKVPAYASKCYPETGVQLRNVIGSKRETTMYLIAGRNHSHYFNDSGSITIWGKGSELCDEDDYQRRRNQQSREAHSMPDKPATYNEERVMDLREFSTSAHLDYVRGIRRGWQRQIAFVKDKDPLAPNYFVVADTLDKKSVPTICRLFLRANKVTPIPMGVTVTGKEDVDMDIFFLQPGVAKPRIHKDHISVNVEKSGTLTAVLYPRLRTEKRPTVTPLAGGKGVKVVTSVGTDVIYLSPEPIKAMAAGKAFEGKVCLVKKRKGRPIRVLPGDCDVKPGWEGGDRQLRMIPWDGPQYPIFPDYKDAICPNEKDILVLQGKKPVSVSDFEVLNSGAQPKQTTSVSLNWAKRGMDVVFDCKDNGIVAAQKGHDNIKLWKDDSVYLWLDPGHVHNNNKMIMIQVSAGGECHDLRDNDPAFDVKGMKIKISRIGKGWRALLSIPWKGLGMKTPEPGDVWGVNFSRMDQPGKLDHKNMEISTWVTIPRGTNLTTFDRWGHIVFGGKSHTVDKTTRKAIEKAHKARLDTIGSHGD